MPQLVNVPGVGQVNFPDGMSHDDIVSAIEKDILPKTASNQSSFQSAIPQTSQNPNAQSQTSSPSMWDSIKSSSNPITALVRYSAANGLQGLVRGLKDDYQGVRQMATQAGEYTGLLPKGSTDQYTQQVTQDRNAYANTSPGQSFIGQKAELAGQTLPYMLIPGGMGEGLLKKAITGGLAGAATGATQFVPQGSSRALNTALGVLLGAVAPSVIAGGSKLINAIKGGTEAPEQQAIIQAAQKANVPVYAANLTDNPHVQAISNMLEDVPIIGTRGQLKSQMQAANTAAQNVTSDLKNQMLETPYGGRTGVNVINDAAQGNGIRAKSAQDLLDEMQNAGDDWNRIAQTSQNVKLFRSKLIADQKYDKVSQLADKYGPVPPTNALQAIDSGIQEVQNSVLPDNGLLSKLQTIKENMQSKPMVYSQMRDARGTIGNLIDSFYQGSNAAIPKDGVGPLQAIKNAIGQDMDKFAQSNGNQLKTVWKNADNFYQQAVAPAKDKLLAQSLTNQDPDTIYSKWIMQGDKKDRATRFYNSLDDKGKAAIRYGMVDQALEAAQKSDGMFSPAQFSSQLNKIRGARGVFFTGDAKNEIDGFTNLMQHVSRSYQAINKPDTGVKTIPYIIGGLLGLGAHAVGAGTGTLALAGAGALGLKTLMTTNAGRRLLLASSKLKAGTPEMQNLVDKTSQFLQRSGVIAGVNHTDNLQQNTQ